MNAVQLLLLGDLFVFLEPLDESSRFFGLCVVDLLLGETLIKLAGLHISLELAIDLPPVLFV